MARKSGFDSIAILDFGSQYTQLIARRVREHGVFSEILPHDTKALDILKSGVKGIILSGGPASVRTDKSPGCDKDIFNLGLPILGVCYGMQLMSKTLGGRVHGAERREYGFAKLSLRGQSPLFSGVKRNSQVWMSHGDEVAKLPEGFKVIAATKNAPIAAIEDRQRAFYGVKFHS